MITRASLFLSMFLAACSSKSLPPLKTLEINTISAGVQEIESIFVTSNRNEPGDYWDYKFGFGTSSKIRSPIAGEIVVYSYSIGQETKVVFDSTRESNWLGKGRTSHLLPINNIEIKDGSKYRIKVKLKRPVSEDVQTVLHFHSY